METPRYITQISSDWIQRVTQATNLKPGPGIKITPDNDGIKIEVDQDALKQWLWTYIKNATTAVNTVTLSNLDSIILDPGL